MKTKLRLSRGATLVGVGLLPLLAGCETASEVELGQGILLCAVPLLALTLVIARLYVALRFEQEEAVPTLPRRTLVGTVVAVCVAVVFGLFVSDWRPGYAADVFVFGVAGLGHLGFTALGLEMLRTVKPRHWSVAVVFPMAALVGTGFLMAVWGAKTPGACTPIRVAMVPLLGVAMFLIGPLLLPVQFISAYRERQRQRGRIPRARVARLGGR